MICLYGLGTNRFSVSFGDLDSNNDLTVTSYVTHTMITLTSNGMGSALYHTHEIIFIRNGTANYMFDGMSIAGGWTGSDTDWHCGTDLLGRGQFGKPGADEFPPRDLRGYQHGLCQLRRRVPTAILSQRSVRPIRVGRSSLPHSSTNTAVTDISPDTALLPLATTLAANQFMLGQRTVERAGKPSRLTSDGDGSNGERRLHYGNTTTPQSGRSWNQFDRFFRLNQRTVVGTNYHFRAVVSNAFGVVNGTNQTFNLGVFLPGVTTQPADQLTSTSARFNGLVNPQGWPTVAWFEWGTTIGYGNVTVPQPAGSGISAVGVSNVIGSLLGEVTTTFASWPATSSGSQRGPTSRSLPAPLSRPISPACLGVFESSVAWGDYDNDGRLDFLLTGLTISGGPVSQLWRNTGSGFTNVTHVRRPAGS